MFLGIKNWVLGMFSLTLVSFSLGPGHCFVKCLACLTLLHSERPKLYAILAFLSAKGLMSLVLFDGTR